MVTPVQLAERPIEKWLYGEWSKEKYDTYLALHQLPLVGQYLDYKLDQRADAEYMNRYGLDWSDIHDPRKLHQTSSGHALYGSTYNWIGKNIGRLYQ